jgi:hypothetical protein
MQTLTLLLLTLSLGSPSWPEREKAHALLAAHLSAAEPVLRWGAALGEPEVQARCGLLLDQWARGAGAHDEAQGYPWTPWIDSLPHGYPERAQIIAAYLVAVDCVTLKDTWDGAPTWPRYRLATVYWLQDRLRAGVALAELQALLETMAGMREGVDRKHQHGFTFTPEQLQAAGVK